MAVIAKKPLSLESGAKSLLSALDEKTNEFLELIPISSVETVAKIKGQELGKQPRFGTQNLQEFIGGQK